MWKAVKSHPVTMTAGMVPSGSVVGRTAHGLKAAREAQWGAGWREPTRRHLLSDQVIPIQGPEG